MANHRIDTIETEANVPYTAMMTPDTLTYTEAPPTIVSSFTDVQKINPIHFMGYAATNGCP